MIDAPAPSDDTPAPPPLPAAAAGDAPAPEAAWDTGWRALPDAARRAYRLGAVTGWGITGLVATVVSGVLALAGDHPLAFGLAALAAPLAGAALGWWQGGHAWRHTAFRLDADGLHLRRGRWWQTQVLVPRSRVQHMDVQRGPIERPLGLATLIVHTAGTRLNAVQVKGLALEDAERMRDALVRESDHDDDAV